MRSKATWDVIVEAAAQVLERRGLAGFNTNAIAERAGVSVGSVYRYFPDKHAILAAAARRAFARDGSGEGSRRGALLEALISVVEEIGRLGDGGRPPVVSTQRVGRAVASRAKPKPSALDRIMQWVSVLMVEPSPEPVPLRVAARARPRLHR